MAQTVRTRKVVGNPGRRAFGSPYRKRTAARKPRRRNPGQIVGWTLGNPGRKKGHMTKAKRKSNAGSHKKRYSRRRKSNPGTSHRRRHHRVTHRRYKRNPGMGISGVGHLVTNAVFTIIGALGSKLGAQMVLGSNNTGLIGYAGNAAAGGVLWFLAEKVLKNRGAAEGVLAGTAVQIVLRLINDYTPFGSYTANLGMGDYQMQSFVTPQVLVAPMQNADIRIPNGWAPTIQLPAAPMKAAAAGMGGMWGGRGMY